MNKVILYTPLSEKKGRFLEKSLIDEEIPFIKVTEVEEIYAAGISEVPALEVDGKRYIFQEAKDWIRGKANESNE
jgi:hypothetical protein